jgi:hypothetical protein
MTERVDEKLLSVIHQHILRLYERYQLIGQKAGEEVARLLQIIFRTIG